MTARTHRSAQIRFTQSCLLDGVDESVGMNRLCQFLQRRLVIPSTEHRVNRVVEGLSHRLRFGRRVALEVIKRLFQQIRIHLVKALGEKRQCILRFGGYKTHTTGERRQNGGAICSVSRTIPVARHQHVVGGRIQIRKIPTRSADPKRRSILCRFERERAGEYKPVNLLLLLSCRHTRRRDEDETNIAISIDPRLA